MSEKNLHIFRILSVLKDNLSRTNALHQEFLNAQRQSLLAVSPEVGLNESSDQPKPIRESFISKDQLREFGVGSIEKCFGPEFAILDQRKSPRIPNGDLLMMDRIVSINGKRGSLKPPASIVSEFDVPDNTWFLEENEYSGIPFSLLMEIALQPCGILSAYLGTSLELPAENNQFRNLDGEIFFRSCPELPGKTITNQAALLDSFSSGGMHIQKYAFKLAVDETVFLEGESSFGYFSKAAMEKQTGLGHQDQVGNGNVSLEINSTHSKHLDLVDSLHFIDNSGKYAKGIIRGEKHLSGNEWFYENHFFQDPVMPGSLGMEAVMQGLWAFIRYKQFEVKFSNPIVDFSNADSFVWKYRGQVIPDNRLINFQIHLKEIQVSDSLVNLTADADFWVDGTRIYAFNNISLTVREG